MPSISVTVPARGEFVHLLRSVIASAAAIEDFSFDEIEDLRIAVDEACAHLLKYAGGAATMTVRIDAGGGTMEVIAAADGSPGRWPPADVHQELAWQVLAALTDETEFQSVGESPAIHFVKRRS